MSTFGDVRSAAHAGDREALRAHRHEHPTLSAYIMIGSHKIEVLSLNDAETSIQRAVLPIRREALDNHWTPWAQANDSDEVREATRLLYACLDDPTLRDAAWAAARDASRDAAWADINHRVAVALIKETLR